MPIKYLVKIDRLAAWGLLASILAYFISGYGMTKGIIGASLAVKIHNEILPLLAVVFFTIHTSYAVHLALKRWRIWNLFTKFLLVLAYLIFVGGIIYLDKFYQRPTVVVPAAASNPVTSAVVSDEDDDNATQPSATAVKPATSAPGASAKPASNTFTLAQLAQYDGLNGNAPYVAVNGVVYDMTGIFGGGYHFGHKAGTDLTNAFLTKHIMSQITKYPVKGTITK